MSRSAEEVAVSPEDEELLRRYEEAMTADADGSLRRFSSLDEYRRYLASR